MVVASWPRERDSRGRGTETSEAVSAAGYPQQLVCEGPRGNSAKSRWSWGSGGPARGSTWGSPCPARTPRAAEKRCQCVVSLGRVSPWGSHSAGCSSGYGGSRLPGCGFGSFILLGQIQPWGGGCATGTIPGEARTPNLPGTSRLPETPADVPSTACSRVSKAVSRQPGVVPACKTRGNASCEPSGRQWAAEAIINHSICGIWKSGQDLWSSVMKLCA